MNLSAFFAFLLLLTPVLAQETPVSPLQSVNSCDFSTLEQKLDYTSSLSTQNLNSSQGVLGRMAEISKEFHDLSVKLDGIKPEEIKEYFHKASSDAITQVYLILNPFTLFALPLLVIAVLFIAMSLIIGSQVSTLAKDNERQFLAVLKVMQDNGLKLKTGTIQVNPVKLNSYFQPSKEHESIEPQTQLKLKKASEKP